MSARAAALPQLFYIALAVLVVAAAQHEDAGNIPPLDVESNANADPSFEVADSEGMAAGSVQWSLRL
jgi:hypothetical protein